jgi:hypothetical protein
MLISGQPPALPRAMWDSWQMGEERLELALPVNNSM